MLFQPHECQLFFSGFRRSWTTNWPQVAILSLTRVSPVCLFPRYGVNSARSQPGWIGSAPMVAARVWALEQDPIKLIVKTLKDMGLAEKTIGVELGSPNTYMLLSISDFEAIKGALPRAKFQDAVPRIWRQRMIKTPWEQETMRKLADISVKGGPGRHRPGPGGHDREGNAQDLLAYLPGRGRLRHPHGRRPDVQGRRHQIQHGHTPDRWMTPCRPGLSCSLTAALHTRGITLIFRDTFALANHRNFTVRLTEISEEGQKAAEAMVKPGKLIKDVHAAAMSVIDHVPEDLKKQGVEFLVFPHLHGTRRRAVHPRATLG